MLGGQFSLIHWVLVAVIVLLLFGGRGKISGLMGDAAKGIRAFRDGLKGEEAQAEAEPEESKPMVTEANKARSTSTRKKTSAR